MGHQLLLATGICVDDDHRLLDRRVPVERRLDLAQFDAQAPEFDLEVEAPQELQRAVGAPARHVAGAVQPRAGLSRPRVGVEGGGGALRVVQVAAAHADASDAQLAGHADRQRLPVRVQHVQPHVRQRPADRHRRGLGRQRAGEDVVRGVVRAFGRAIGVQDRNPRVAREPGVAQCGRQRLTRQRQPAQCGQRGCRLVVGLQLVQHEAQQRRHHLQHRDTLGLDVAQQRGGILRDLVAEDAHRAADEQCGEELPHRDVEAGRRGLRQRVGRAEAVIEDLGAQVVDHAAVFDHYALGHAGGAGGEQHIGQPRRVGRAVRIVRWLAG